MSDFKTMNYAVIKKNDVANGPGVRVSLFVSGCRHRCPECFNSEAWDFEYGKPFDDEVIKEILDACDRPFIDGLSILGGEPLECENQGGVYTLLREFRSRFPQKSVWCYTGFELDTELCGGGSRADTPILSEILSLVDVLVDGRFVPSMRDLSLRFRGSSNQRIIDMKKTTDLCRPMLWDESFDAIEFRDEVKENEI